MPSPVFVYRSLLLGSNGKYFLQSGSGKRFLQTVNAYNSLTIHERFWININDTQQQVS